MSEIFKLAAEKEGRRRRKSVVAAVSLVPAICFKTPDNCASPWQLLKPGHRYCHPIDLVPPEVICCHIFSI